MNFLSLLGKKLKDDCIVDILDFADIEVIYEFDRSHENLEDLYWAQSKQHGFQFRFDKDQILDNIFIYARSAEGFTAVDRNLVEGISFF